MAFTPSSSDAAGCLTSLEDVSPALRALGACSFVVATLIGVPQCVKIARRKSSRGVSFWTLGLTNVGGFLSVLNMYVLHYDQIALAGSPLDDFGAWARAQASLLFLWVELANTLSMLAVWPLAYAHVEDSERAFVFSFGGATVEWSMKKALRMGLVAQATVVVAAWAPALWVLSSAGECAPLAWYGNAMGVLVSLIIMMKFLPQVKESIGERGSGSLSYVTYGADVCAGMVALAQKLFVTRERVSTWMPPLILHSMEVYVLAINYLNDRAKLGDGLEHRRRDATDGAERGDSPYGSDEERVQSERLLPRGNRGAGGGDVTSPRVASPTREAGAGTLTWSKFLDVFL